MGEARFQHVRKTPDIGEMHNLYSRDYDNQDKLQNVDEILATHFVPPSASAGVVIGFSALAMILDSGIFRTWEMRVSSSNPKTPPLIFRFRVFRGMPE